MNARIILSRALPSAVRGGHDGIIQILLTRGAVMSHDPDYRGFLHRAAEYGHNNTIKFLLPQVPQDYYVCPHVGRGGNEDRLYLYYPGKSEYQHIPFESLTYENWCCLHFAIHNGHQDTVKFLLKNKIMPPRNPEYRATALPLAALRGHAEITKLLVAAGFDTSAILWRFTALELASKYGHTEVIKVLLDAGVPATALDLANAVSSGSIPAVSLLLEKGANLHGIAARTGDTALHAAVCERNKEMVEFILKSGANVEILDSSGSTPLYRALERHNGDAVQLLFKYGAIAEPQIRSGAKSVLHHALIYGAGELVPLLLEHGAKVEAKTNHGMTPFLQAGSCGSVPAIEALRTAGCHIHARDNMQRTALHHAAKGYTDAVKALLRLGLDPNARDAEGKTPLHLTPVSRMSPVYDLLVRHGGDDKAVDHEGHSVDDYQRQSYNANYG
jgi:ankyrin repeat protein